MTYLLSEIWLYIKYLVMVISWVYCCRAHPAGRALYRSMDGEANPAGWAPGPPSTASQHVWGAVAAGDSRLAQRGRKGECLLFGARGFIELRVLHVALEFLSSLDHLADFKLVSSWPNSLISYSPGTSFNELLVSPVTATQASMTLRVCQLYVRESCRQ